MQKKVVPAWMVYYLVSLHLIISFVGGGILGLQHSVSAKRANSQSSPTLVQAPIVLEAEPVTILPLPTLPPTSVSPPSPTPTETSTPLPVSTPIAAPVLPATYDLPANWTVQTDGGNPMGINQQIKASSPKNTLAAIIIYRSNSFNSSINSFLSATPRTVIKMETLTIDSNPAYRIYTDRIHYFLVWFTPKWAIEIHKGPESQDLTDAQRSELNSGFYQILSSLKAT